MWEFFVVAWLAGTGSPALDVLLPVPHQGQREDRADDDFSSILDMLCPQASPEAPPGAQQLPPMNTTEHPFAGHAI